jgi:hypothetical protein
MPATRRDEPWYRQPSILARRPLDFFPTRDASDAERLNAMVRFTAYATLAVAMYRGAADARAVISVGLLVALVLTLLYSSRDGFSGGRPQGSSGSVEARCTEPTAANPFMNVLTTEYALDKPTACGPIDNDMSQAYFDKGLPREISDVYHNRASDRQFVTMPVSGAHGVPDTLAFRNYLYGPPGAK